MASAGMGLQNVVIVEVEAGFIHVQAGLGSFAKGILRIPMHVRVVRIVPREAPVVGLSL